MCRLGDGSSQYVGGLQAAAENLFLEDFIPPLERVEDVLSGQVDSGIAAGQPRRSELILSEKAHSARPALRGQTRPPPASFQSIDIPT